MRILIAEDDVTSRAILSAILKKRGYEVVKTVNGAEALAELQKEDAPHLAILDWMMPEMDGLEVIEKVRGMDFPLQPYIIMLTAKNEKTDLVKALDKGADDLLAKPCNADELASRVQVGERMIEVQAKLIAQTDELRETHSQLAHAQKLEAVGQLAAGIAHEINTPTQFVGDSVHFLKEAFEDQRGLIAQYRQAMESLGQGTDYEEIVEVIKEAEEAADVEYLDENVPGSFDRSFDGLQRIATIVGAMKEFAHPDQREKSPADINQAIQATLTITKSEYKYVADAETEFEELPQVKCHVGDLNQVFLNLLVNAAHAIGDMVGDSGDKGVIKVRTFNEGEFVRIEFSDTGSGIPDSVREKIFDPFFTTKEVGKGSGQGLAIARNIIVDKHFGELSCESEEGKGTRFNIRLPVSGKGAEKMEEVVS